MRCIIVNGANLKAQAFCAHCSQEIGNSYIREIGSRLIYCDFRCYSVALETSIVLTRGYSPPGLGAWTRRS
jgi:hypothetical protein